MLREKLGDEDFFRALHHYLEANRGQNVVTADLQKAIEQATSRRTWTNFSTNGSIGAGAPKFDVGYAYDADGASDEADREADAKSGRARRSVRRARGHRNRHGEWHARLTPIEVSQASQTFHFPGGRRAADGGLRQGRQNHEVARFQEEIPRCWSIS